MGYTIFNKAIEINPRSEIAYISRGFSKLNLGQYQGAIMDFTKAIEINAKSAIAYNNRGIAKLNIAQKDGGCSDIRKAIELGYGAAYETLQKYCK